MRAKRIGIDCSRVKQGETYKVIALGDDSIKVTGYRFIYSFKYNTAEELRAEWEIIPEGEDNDEQLK